MLNYDEKFNESVKIIKTQIYIPHHPYRSSISDGSGSGKTNVLLNLIKCQ